ncbi:hypothetical protein D6C98_02948 [Aureobasidium pullulans]|uniref:Cryptic loci regulator 2 N-terminal domain-containing protein n=1 Tax=Aureobasidium pullulans TaxID=5580 RepID=A0A4V4JPT7_AURPU|nr:hypothetical protein D6D24_09041 [Aureobasidium pullulans]THY03513.1 hypothetical protein D6D03_04336 [Aureobasidium pullulans]THY58764.1 hypothetical protein D6C98_02948 [Aureobasidium pullulans]THY81755.1 hypothetical protein D6C93_09445 [Aureobasidium pullulans]THZ14234.1 hypothetical protein D6C89_10215 [Aureobasidium pullulans]
MNIAPAPPAPQPPPVPQPQANQVVNIWLSNQNGSNGVGRVPNIVGYLQVLANHPMFAQFLGNLNKSFFDQYGLSFNFQDLPQGYTLWWKARRGNPTNQQGQVQGAFFVYGHPRGRFESASTFAVHVNSMRTGLNCVCRRC